MRKNEAPVEPVTEAEEDVFGKPEKAARLRELGAIPQEEYDAKKESLLSRI